MLEHAPILCVVIPLMFAFITPVIGLVNKRLCYPLVLVAISLSLLFSILTLREALQHGPLHYKLGNWPSPFGIEYFIDNINGFLLAVTTSITLSIVIYARRSVESEIAQPLSLFYTLLLLLTAGLTGIVASGDIFNIYVFIEISSLSCYALVALGKNPRALISSFNYLIIGSVGACFYLIGVGYVYLATGSLNIEDLSHRLPTMLPSKVLTVAFAFFIVGLSIKSALFPLHFWLPNAYTHAPSTVSALMASLMSKVAIYVMFRIIYKLFNLQTFEIVIPRLILIILAAGAIIVGGVYAILQIDLKRILAYSSIAQIGYIILGVGLANYSSLVGSWLHIFYHAMMKGCLFLIAGGIIYKLSTSNVSKFRNLYKKMPFTMGALTITGLSLIGIPPFCGFFSKWYLLIGAINAKQWLIAAVILLGGLLTAIYIFKVMEVIYFSAKVTDSDAKALQDSSIDELPLSMLIPILILTLVIVVAGVFSGTIIDLILAKGVPVR